MKYVTDLQKKKKKKKVLRKGNCQPNVQSTCEQSLGRKFDHLLLSYQKIFQIVTKHFHCCATQIHTEICGLNVCVNESSQAP